MSKHLIDKVIETMQTASVFLIDPLTMNDAINSVNYLKWLKPTVPQYVADWFEDNSEGSVKYWVTHFEKHDTPDYIADWLNKQDDFFMTLAKMEEFGYFVEGE